MLYKMKRLIKTMKDDLKDSKMCYEYAKEEKEAGNTEMATWYINRGKARMDMFQKDDEKMEYIIREYKDKNREEKVFSKEEEKKQYSLEELWKCFYDQMSEEAYELSNAFSKFKA